MVQQHLGQPNRRKDGESETRNVQKAFRVSNLAGMNMNEWADAREASNANKVPFPTLLHFFAWQNKALMVLWSFRVECSSSC